MAAGEDSAEVRLEELFVKHSQSVWEFACHRVGADTAPDIVSETFLAAWRHIDELREPVLPWLLGAARKVVGNELRRRSRQVALSERLVESQRYSLVVHEPSTRAVVEAMQDLSDLDQDVLMTSAWYGLTSGEAARVLGCSRSAYAVRLHRARRRLGRILEKDGRSDRPRSVEDKAVQT